VKVVHRFPYVVDAVYGPNCDLPYDSTICKHLRSWLALRKELQLLFVLVVKGKDWAFR
jgi:hypothetical protein